VLGTMVAVIRGNMLRWRTVVGNSACAYMVGILHEGGLFDCDVIVSGCSGVALRLL
jgi:hypothetical protein